MAGALERKVWVDTGQKLYPNLYTLLVGRAGLGKSRAINAGISVARQVEGYALGPDTMSKAGLVDVLIETVHRHVGPIPEREVTIWNSVLAAPDEFGNLLPGWDPVMVSALTKFYDCSTYSEAFRVGDVRKAITDPQLNLLTGTTPPFLCSMVESVAWGQGLMSRVIMVYDDKQDMHDMLTKLNGANLVEFDKLVHDLRLIHHDSLYGAIDWDDNYRVMMHEWRLGGMKPKPTNPRLADYCARREANILKLSMIICVDEGGPLALRGDHFKKALTWLLEAEANMSAIFTGSSVTAESRNMDDLIDWLARRGPTSHGRLLSHASGMFHPNTIDNVLNILHLAGRMVKNGEGKWMASDQ